MQLNDLPCRTNNPDLWFSDDPVEVAEAMYLCQLCPIIELCRVWGEREVRGVWGGVARGSTRKVRLPITCAYAPCGIEFSPANSRQKFCSSKHQEAQHRLNKKARDAAAA